jgi:hypothetical protein
VNGSIHEVTGEERCEYVPRYMPETLLGERSDPVGVVVAEIP